MNKGALIFGVVSISVAVGVYGYDAGWFSKKKEETGVGSAAEEDHTGVHKPTVMKELKVPELVGIPEADARSRMKSAGFAPEAMRVLEGKGCGANDENMQPEGNVCAQDPGPNVTLNERSQVDVVIEHDTFEHGAVGYATEWHRMPDLIGSTITDAQSLLDQKGFAATEFEIQKVSSDSVCLPDNVCDTTPQPGKRKPKGMTGIIKVGQRDKGQ